MALSPSGSFKIFFEQLFSLKNIITEIRFISKIKTIVFLLKLLNVKNNIIVEQMIPKNNSNEKFLKVKIKNKTESKKFIFFFKELFMIHY